MVNQTREKGGIRTPRKERGSGDISVSERHINIPMSTHIGTQEAPTSHPRDTQEARRAPPRHCINEGRCHYVPIFTISTTLASSQSSSLETPPSSSLSSRNDHETIPSIEISTTEKKTPLGCSFQKRLFLILLLVFPGLLPVVPKWKPKNAKMTPRDTTVEVFKAQKGY